MDAAASEGDVIVFGDETVSVLGYAQYLTDPDARFSIETIDEQPFREMAQPFPAPGGTAWTRFDVHNATQRDSTRYLVFEARPDALTVWSRSTSGTTAVLWNAGPGIPYDPGEFATRRAVVPISLRAGERQSIYVRYAMTYATPLHLSLIHI